MSSEVKVFDFESQAVRAILVEGEPWWIASDVCRIIGVVNTSDAVSRLDEDQKGIGQTDTLRGKQRATIVNESGLYELVFRSDKDDAKRFRKWVTNEVLPTLRRTGSYDEQLAKYSNDELALLELDPEVAKMERLLKLTRDQAIQKHQLEALRREQAQIVETLKTVDERSTIALDTAMGVKDQVNNRSGWSTALGYARTKGLSVPLGQLGALGRKLTRRCMALDIEVEQISDPRFGYVNIYPDEVLREFEDDFIKAAS